MSQLPKVVQYGNVKPRGFATKYRRWEVNPQASFNSFAPNELVRFSLQTDGWIDPYSSYIQISVQTDPVTMGGDANDFCHLELDGQSTSLIQQMVIYSDSKELERIDEYDQLGSVLNDLALQNLYKAHKSYEGMAFDSVHSNFPGQNTYNYSNATASQWIAAENLNKTYYFHSAQRPTNLIENFRQNAGLDTFNITTLKTQNQFAMPRSENINENRVICALDSFDSEFGIEHFQQTVRGEGDTLNESAINYGWKLPTSNALSGNKSQFLNNVNTLKIVNGKFKKSTSLDWGAIQKTPDMQVKKQKFVVPFLSGLMGVLIPQDQWKLIPGKALKQLNIEFRLNPYAFFTSGKYFDLAGARKQQRNWKITEFKLVFDLWNFDQLVEQQLDQMLQGEGIILSSQSWSLGPMYQIIANGTVTNNWQINNGIESVKSIVFWFLANDYLTYNHCRKNFRLSMNLLQYQLKIGPDFIPPYPIQGHAGNIAMNDQINDDNTDFVKELHKTFGFFFSANRSVKINKLNFALNERSYDPNLEDMKDTELGCGSTGTAYPCRGFDYPLNEERRCCGKALYALDLDSNPHDPDVLSGLDTTQKRPIELIVKGSDTDKFPRDSTMYIMLNHDFYVQFTANGTKTYGQG